MSSSRGTYHHGQLAAALEDAAMQLLERLPATEISLREVARAANVSHNAPYHHFTDRLGLLRVLAERSMRELTEAVESAIASAAGPAQRLRAGGAAYISFAVAHPHAFNVVYDPLVCIPSQPSAAMAPLIERLERALGETAHAAGLGDAAEVRALWGMVHGLGTLCAAGHFTEPEALAASDAALARLRSD
ncbi:TetR/AcrR family transcriptional regulator [Leucobacter luti]|nr:TetR/AcrR family transcriptional regulator [Leucobacter luti]MBL3699612.1 TetR/AcrR family transcriptional regulator [Leucobacter luti]